VELASEIPGWFVYIGGLILFTLAGAFVKLMWGRYIELKSHVEELQRQMARAATLDDLQVISDRMRDDAHAVQSRLDAIMRHLL